MAKCSTLLSRSFFFFSAPRPNHLLPPAPTKLIFGHRSISFRRSSFSDHRMAGGKKPPFVSIPPADTAVRSELLRSLEASLGRPFRSDPLVPSPRPLVTVISGPSGVGKDAVIKRLTESLRSIRFVVTATTRQKRDGEIDGEDYHFVSKEEFESLIEKGELLEHSLVYGDYKGVPKRQIRDHIAAGFDVVLRVDVQGAEKLRLVLGDSAVFIFLVAESEPALVQRLIERGTETEDSAVQRVRCARTELEHMRRFDYAVVNSEGRLEEAVKLIESIIDAEKAKVRQKIAMV